MAITTRPAASGHRLLVYGAPGAGKTYLAASTRRCVFVCVEEGLLGVPPQWETPHPERPPTSLQELVQQIGEAADHARGAGLQHVVLDSLTGCERLVYEAAQRDGGKSYADSIDYGKLWKQAKPHWLRLLDALDRVRRSGLHVWLLAHGSEELASDPETGKQWRRQTIAVEGSADSRAETRTMLVAWADHVLCLTLDVTLVAARGARAVAKVGDRLLWTSSQLGQCVAKNRASLPEELPGTWPALREALARGLAAAPSAQAPPAAAHFAPTAQAPAAPPVAPPAAQAAAVAVQTPPAPPAVQAPQASTYEQRSAELGRLAIAHQHDADALTRVYVEMLSIARSREELDAIGATAKAEPAFAPFDRRRPQAVADAYLEAVRRLEA